MGQAHIQQFEKLQANSKVLYDFSFSGYLKREFRFGIDVDRPYCKAFQSGNCVLENACPDKHYNPNNTSGLVCKHWLRALCKKGDLCEYLHEYNVRRMPECVYYSQHASCPNGDDSPCPYQHIDAASKRAPCPHYERGFCPLGPICANRHVRKQKLCPFYMAGFCPDGRECQNGSHARFLLDLRKPVVLKPPTAAEIEAEKAESAAAAAAAGTHDTGAWNHDGDEERQFNKFQNHRGGAGRGWTRGGIRRGGGPFVKRRGA